MSGALPDAKKRLLIVEDDAFFCRWLQAVLKHDEVAIEFAGNGVEAIAAVRRARPDVVLLDAKLPGMDGFEAFRTLRKDPALAGLRVIFMSGTAEAGALAMAKDLGAWATMRKPMPPKLARAKVYEALGVAPDAPIPTDLPGSPPAPPPPTWEP